LDIQKLKLIKLKNIDFKIKTHKVLLVILLVGVIRAILGSVGDINWDTPIFIDGAWRVAQGQIPHIDFSTAFGPVIFFIGQIGFLLGGININSFDLGLVFFYFLLTPFAFYFTKNKISIYGSVLFTLLVGSYLITPRIFGYNFSNLGLTGYYNIIGYVYLYFIGIEMFYLKNKDSSQFENGIAIGAFSIFAFFTKFTFGFAAIFLILVKLIFSKPKIIWILGLTTGLSSITLAFFIYFDGNLMPVFRDWNLVISSSLTNDGIISHIFSSLFKNITDFTLSNIILFTTPLVGVSIIIILCLFYIKRDIIFIMKILSLFLIGIGITATIGQKPEFAIAPLIGILGFEYLWNQAKGILIKGFLVFSIFVTFTPLVFNNLLSFVPATHKVFNRGNDKYIQTPVHSSLKGAFFNKKITFNDEYFDGIQILDSVVMKHDRIAVLGVNLFSFSFLLPSPKKDLLYWHNGVTYSQKTLELSDFMIKDSIFQDISILMIPLKSSHSTKNAFIHYENYIKDNYILYKESNYWLLYRRKTM
jgi:hypothetical protein